MAKEHIRLIDSHIQIQSALLAADELIRRGLPGGSVDLVVRRHEEVRSSPQSNKSHAMYADIKRDAVIKIIGKRIVMNDYTIDEVKALLVVWFANERALEGRPLKKPPRTVVCPLTGENITIRPSTAEDFSKADTIEYIEFLYSIGSDSGVKWSEQALKEYSTYKQAQ